MTEARVSRLALEVLNQDPDPDARVSRLYVEVLQSVDEEPAPPTPPSGGGNRMGDGRAIRRSPRTAR